MNMFSAGAVYVLSLVQEAEAGREDHSAHGILD